MYGVETISGSLGIGFRSSRVASSLKIKKILVVFVIIGDGELNEGIVWSPVCQLLKTN